VDKKGNIQMPFNTEGMYRASSKGGKRFIGIYKD
jgi:isoaspartyl peptidase/L-asparaginase-like protein (Ntn-hydrolase superfamily)